MKAAIDCISSKTLNTCSDVLFLGWFEPAKLLFPRKLTDRQTNGWTDEKTDKSDMKIVAANSFFFSNASNCHLDVQTCSFNVGFDLDSFDVVGPNILIRGSIFILYFLSEWTLCWLTFSIFFTVKQMIVLCKPCQISIVFRGIGTLFLIIFCICLIASGRL